MEVVNELPANQPRFTVNKLGRKLTRSGDGGVLKLHLTGEILQPGWEIAQRIYSYTFALQFPVGARIDERQRVIQYVLQFTPVFDRKKGAPRGNPFDISFALPLTERDIRNCVIQFVMGGDKTEDFLLFHDGRYYPGGKPYNFDLPPERSEFKQPKWARPPTGKEDQKGLEVDNEKSPWRAGAEEKSP